MKPFTMYIIGLSGSGKSTLAEALAERLHKKGAPVEVIDGDVLRQELGDMFGYTREDRIKQGRVGWVLARHLNRNGISVLIAATAGCQDVRERAREFIGEGYLQVYLDCPIEECIRRDVKGYYKDVSKLKNFYGIDMKYDVPEDSELTVDTVHLSVEQSAGQVMSYLEENGFC
ncbi:MAG: adenylyl-sulfate kinase [Lawsonibacter sp.]|nr:adenylyl-sulfate kinase [Lawsonibacter sp.]